MTLTQDIDMTYTGAVTEALAVSGARWGRISVGEAAGSLGSGVITLQQSVNGLDWYDTGTTVTGSNISSELDLEGIAHLRGKVTTAASGATARVTIYAEGA